MPMPLFAPPESHPIGQLFDAKAPFVVDPYQRDYAWTYLARPNEDTDDGEVADFIYDLKRVIDEAEAMPEDDYRYFFGLVVTAQQPNIGWIPDEKHEVVDGQQRVTTFVLLASAMNHVAEAIQLDAKRLGQNDAAKRCKNFRDFLTARCIERKLNSTVGLDPAPFNVLTLTAEDNDFFQKLIRGKSTGEPTRDSCVLLAKAREALIAAVEDWLPPGTPEQREKALTSIRNIVFDRADVILITAKNTVDAYRLFAVANNRGKKLEQADLLRAYCLRLVSTSSDETIAKDVARAWNDIDKRKPEVTNAALRAYYGSIVGQRAPKVDVYDAFARDIFGHSEYDTLTGVQVDELRSKVDDLRAAVDLYDKLAAGTWPYSTKTQSVSDWQRHLLGRVITGLKSVRAIPLLLAAATQWAKEEKRFASLMEFVEKAEFRFLLSSAHQSTVGDKYLEAAVMVRKGGSPEDLIAFLESWVAFLAADDAFKAGVTALSYKRANRVRHLLAMLDDYWPAFTRSKKGGSSKVQPNELRNWNMGSADIDHIYPQGATTDPQLSEVKHRLGNLTLLLDSDNQVEAKMHLPTDQEKIDIYETSLVKLTEKLGEQLHNDKAWTAHHVDIRRDSLVEMAEFVYQVSAAAKTAAAGFETRGRRRAAKSTPRDNPVVWWFTNEKAPDKAVSGREYQFGKSQRAGSLVQTGDFAIEFEPIYASDGRRTWADDRILGIGRIGNVDEILGASTNENRRAVFSRHHVFNPPVQVKDLSVADSRDRTRNLIKDGTDEVFDELQSLAGFSDRDSLPEVKRNDA